MIIEFSLIILAFAKVLPAFSTLAQAYFALSIPVLCWFRRRNLLVRDYIFIGTLFSMIIFSTIINSGNLIYGIKNGIYLLLLPLLRGLINPFWIQKRLGFISLLTLIVLIWYIINPSSYITSEFGGSPRMVGFGVNPNVWGLTCVLLLSSWRVWTFKNPLSQLMTVGVLIASVFLSGSSTALLCLPLAAALSIRHSSIYIIVLIAAISGFFSLVDDELISLVPSLFARFDLWTAAINEVKPLTLVIGNGYDFFGAGISTVSSEEIRVVDSFYISSFVSGGILTISLIMWYFLFSPLTSALRNNDRTLFCIVIIFMIANATGNFMENGFPSNLIYWLLVLSLQHGTKLQKATK